MKTLIAEDDFTSRVIIQEILKRYGPCHIAVNGIEAVEAFRRSLEEKKPYELICLDVIMPEMDGLEALRRIRELEGEVKIPGFGRSRITRTGGRS